MPTNKLAILLYVTCMLVLSCNNKSIEEYEKRQMNYLYIYNEYVDMQFRSLYNNLNYYDSLDLKLFYKLEELNKKYNSLYHRHYTSQRFHNSQDNKLKEDYISFMTQANALLQTIPEKSDYQVPNELPETINQFDINQKPRNLVICISNLAIVNNFMIEHIARYLSKIKNSDLGSKEITIVAIDAKDLGIARFDSVYTSFSPYIVIDEIKKDGIRLPVKANYSEYRNLKELYFFENLPIKNVKIRVKHNANHPASINLNGYDYPIL